MPRLKEYERMWLSLERTRKAALDALLAAGADVVGYFAEDQRGTQKPVAGLDRPYPDGVLPPILHTWPGEVNGLKGEWAKFMPQIIAGDRRTIDDLAQVVYGSSTYQWQQKDALLDPSAGDLAEALANSISFARMPQIDFTKPPWWDQRAAGIQVPPGTGERSQKMLLLMRDYTETWKWVEKHVEAKDGSYSLLIQEIKKDKPDQAKIDEYVKNLEYARYMMAQTSDLSGEVMHGKRMDWTDDGSNQQRRANVVPPVEEKGRPTRVAYDPAPPPAPIGPREIVVPVPEKPTERSKCSAPARRK